MQRWLKIVLPALVLALCLGTGAMAFAAGSPDPGLAHGAAHGRHEGHGKHQGKAQFSPDRALEHIRQNPQQAVEHLNQALARVQERQQSLSTQIASDGQRAAALKDPAQKEIAQAALAVRQAELTRLQARAALLQKLLAYARTQAGKG